jgi:hypothetical protein
MLRLPTKKGNTMYQKGVFSDENSGDKIRNPGINLAQVAGLVKKGTWEDHGWLITSREDLR